MSSNQPGSSRIRSGEAIKKLFGWGHGKTSNATRDVPYRNTRPPFTSSCLDDDAPSDWLMNEAKLKQLISDVKDYLLTNGSVLKLVRFEELSSVPARPVGVSILPTPFPRRLFESAVAVQPLFTELYLRAASDDTWFHEVFNPLLGKDRFLDALHGILMKVKEAGTLQDVVCGVFRSDYMVHESEHGVGLKQVEFNTFSAAGACHAERVGRMHRHLQRVHKLNQTNQPQNDLPETKNTSMLVEMLVKAHGMYEPRTSRRSGVLMVVQPNNFNVADERPIEYGLWDAQVACYRCLWQDVLECTTVEADQTLIFRPSIHDTELEVTVVYYRAGIDAAEYHEKGIQTRLHLELSRAIQCPDVSVHLATFKAVQASLARPGILERFLPAESVRSIRKTFMPMQILNSSPEGQKFSKLATNPNTAGDYVLKPNLEGGGHNIYRQDIPNFLRSTSKDQWPNFILMKLINSPPRPGVLMTFEEVYQDLVVSELGILGTCIWRRNNSGLEILSNEVAGWTYKSKPINVDEMSVVKGYGCFDCPLLVEDSDDDDDERST